MPYAAQISRSDPTAFLFLVDQSGSMEEQLSSEKSKAQQVANVLNRTLATFVTRCTKSDGVRNYFDIGVIGYGDESATNGFKGSLGTSILNPIAAIEASPLHVDEMKKKLDDGAGGVVESIVKFPVWFEPRASGGTPMCEAITKAAEVLASWCDAHPNSYPPTVLHVTDGASTDGSPEPLASQLREIHTNDGPVLLFNLHTSTAQGSAIEFPEAEELLPDDYSKMLFRMSSVLPEHLVAAAQEKGFKASQSSRGFMFNAADPVQIVEFFDIGTRASQLR